MGKPETKVNSNFSKRVEFIKTMRTIKATNGDGEKVPLFSMGFLVDKFLTNQF